MTLQGKSYYEITDIDILQLRDYFEIDPFLSNGTLIRRIQVNFNLSGDVRLPYVLLVLPDLTQLNGNWNLEIVISTTGSKLEQTITVASYNYVDNNLPEQIYSLPTGYAVALNGISDNNYSGGLAVFRPIDFQISTNANDVQTLSEQPINFTFNQVEQQNELL